jgi:hypothetical protein
MKAAREGAQMVEFISLEQAVNAIAPYVQFAAFAAPQTAFPDPAFQLAADAFWMGCCAPLDDIRRRSMAAWTLNRALNDPDVPAPRWLTCSPSVGFPVLSGQIVDAGVHVLRILAHTWSVVEAACVRLVKDAAAASRADLLSPDVIAQFELDAIGVLNLSSQRGYRHWGFSRAEFIPFLDRHDIGHSLLPPVSERTSASLVDGHVSSNGQTGHLKIGANDKELTDAFIAKRAREIHLTDKALVKGKIAESIAGEMKNSGHAGERGRYLSAATVEKAIPAGLTGGRAKNGRKARQR